MAQDVLNLDEESFEQVKTLLSQHALFVREHYDNAAKKIAALSGTWDDDDYQRFQTAFSSLKSKTDEFTELTDQLIAKAEYKIEMIRARRNIQF